MIIVTGSLQNAVDLAQPGTILLLEARTYTETKVEIRRSGRADAPITLRGLGADTSRLNGRLRITTAAHWIIEDLSVTPTDQGDAIRLEEPANNIRLQRMHLSQGEGYGIRVGTNVQSVVIEQNEIDHFDAGSSDAHGIGVMTASQVVIRANRIHDTSGDAIQLNTPDYPGYGRAAQDILIEYNQLYSCRENGLDVKSTHGLVVRYNQFWDFQPSADSTGMALQIQHDTRDAQIIGNQFRNVAQGIELSRGKKDGTVYPAMPQQVTIRGNLFVGIGTAALPQAVPGVAPLRLFLPVVRAPGSITGGTSGDVSSRDAGNAIIILTSRAVIIEHNSIVAASSAAVYLGESANSGPPTSISIRNNLLQGQKSDLATGIDLGRIDGLLLDSNHYAGQRILGEPVATWMKRMLDPHATAGDPQLDSANLPQPGSPLIDSGLNIGLPFKGAAPDRGWSEWAEPV